MDSIVGAAEGFKDKGHFDSENIQAKKASVVERYQAVMVNIFLKTQSIHLTYINKNMYTYA